MRILITTSTFPVHKEDGIPRFVMDLALALRPLGSVSVVAPDAPGAPLTETIEGMEVRRFSYFWPRSLQRLALGEGMRDNMRRSLLAKLQVPLFILQHARITGKVARERGVDVVNAHWLVPGGLAAAWARGRKSRFKLVIHCHAGDVYLLRKIPLGAAIARWVLSRADHVLADGSHVRDSLIELTGFSGEIRLRPMGVSTSLFGRPQDPGNSGADIGGAEDLPKKFLLFFGRFSEKKGAIYLVRALPGILKEIPDLELIMIGDGPERPSVEAETEKLGVGSVVHFLGRRSHREIVRFLHACQAAVVPSIIDSHGETEGMPTVVLEAMGAGVRVVASAVDGIPDIIEHGVNGWLAEEKNPDDLAAKILLSLADPSAPGVVSEALRTASQHDWVKVGEEYATLLENSGKDTQR